MARLAVVVTDDIAQTERSQIWKTWLSTYVARDPDDLAASDISFSPGDSQDFRGCIEYGDLGDASLCRVRSDACRYLRQPAKMPQDAPSAAMIVLQTRGTSVFRQGQRQDVLRPGDWSLYDTSRAFSIASEGEGEHLVLLHPRSAEPPLQAALGHLAARSFGRTGIERMVREQISSAFRECHTMPLRSGNVVANSILQLVASALEASNDHPAGVAIGLRQRIVQFIDEHLGDEHLTVARIAEAFGYSSRQIHRMFGDETGMTVAQYLWQRRLAQSLKDLQDSEQAGCTITEIAFRWGFSNAAHFSHAFKQAYGLSPRECRMAARC
ncbi:MULTISPECIES: helix-turn-helix domain-containing protein [unclassified Herbaspirillum]|uniref:helix-turn-helix domain-containing protein n=1 Tax=unclassified Herbaspirillum TaxID=2624150 RepID=UPI00115252E0|nr:MULTISPECIES: helix-turn-helix domain-containing protein [unclassified Herbaspirillum]MBB5391248.1 AraC-like DNA-binding protein [Herbaspirillum sp. SJZ102]TQK13064.1 AraC family transcriptional regulator [Herbaspirillum sp. SJZ130]TQK15068.1 AraC family transcriptional regulator [Herbaspirillum sp. SJZ106]